MDVFKLKQYWHALYTKWTGIILIVWLSKQKRKRSLLFCVEKLITIRDRENARGWVVFHCSYRGWSGLQKNKVHKRWTHPAMDWCTTRSFLLCNLWRDLVLHARGRPCQAQVTLITRLPYLFCYYLCTAICTSIITSDSYSWHNKILFFVFIFIF